MKSQNSELTPSRPAQASKPPLERHSQTTARAAKIQLERTDNNEGPARVSESLLERESQNLGNYSWFLSPTNLLQTCPTHPITQIQSKKGCKQDNDQLPTSTDTCPDHYTTTVNPGSLYQYTLTIYLEIKYSDPGFPFSLTVVPRLRFRGVGCCLSLVTSFNPYIESQVG